MPFGDHPLDIWKDSLSIDSESLQQKFPPLLFFSIGRHSPTSEEPTFSEWYARFAKPENRWRVFPLLNDHLREGGVSSHDGGFEEFVFNEYLTSGWGAYASRPGSISSIPGVSNHKDPIYDHSGRVTVGYPLIGSGVRGITAIRSAVQSHDGDLNTRTCLHMNPSLFTDINGRRWLIVDLWARSGRQQRAPCRLVDGTQLPSDGNLFYHYEGDELGWQLDIRRGVVGDPKIGALHAIPGSSHLFLGTRFGFNGAQNASRGPQILLIDSNSNASLPLISCHDISLHFAEVTGDNNTIYFLVDYPIAAKSIVHDIYVAYKRLAKSLS